MALLDFILNFTALLLWLNGLAIRFDPLVKTSAASLVGTLRKADPRGAKQWKLLATLGGLIVLRAIVYWQLSASIHSTPKIDFGFIEPSFRGDAREWFSLLRMLTFSCLSFGVMLSTFYMWVLFLSLVNSTVPDTDPFQKLVRLHFQWLERSPWFIKLVVPFVVGTLLWLVLQPFLARLSVVPPTRSAAQLFEQAAVIGAGTYLAWKYLIVGILLLHLLNSYVYLGNHAFWSFINATARNVLHPFRRLPLRFAKVDFLPVVLIALVFLFTELLTNPPHWLRQWVNHSLPF